MQVEAKSIDEIQPYENNPRDNDDAVDAVANSIKEFGWQQPIVVDNEGVIIAGHTRYKAAQKLGLKTVPVVVAKDLTEEQVKAYRLADNKTAELADWDMGLLNEELDQIRDIDMSDFGFDEVNDDNVDDYDFDNEAVPDDDIPVSTYALNVVCKDEEQQKELFDELSKRGLEVKVVNL